MAAVAQIPADRDVKVLTEKHRVAIDELKAKTQECHCYNYYIWCEHAN